MSSKSLEKPFYLIVISTLLKTAETVCLLCGKKRRNLQAPGLPVFSDIKNLKVKYN